MHPIPCAGERTADMKLLRNAGDFGVSDSHWEGRFRTRIDGVISEGQTPLNGSELRAVQWCRGRRSMWD
jgi:hypothetical protein